MSPQPRPRAATLSAIFRHPVKSMLGEDLEQAALGPAGIPGDRAWALRDEVRGGFKVAKRVAALMSCSARYREQDEPVEAGAPAPPPEIRLPDGVIVRAADPEASERIAKAIGHEVTLWPLLPADKLEHYRPGRRDNPDIEVELRAIFARTPDEPLPDLASFPRELMRYDSPPGTYFDAFPLLVLSRQSLAALAAAAPDSQIDVRRFRPNLVLDAPGDATFPEQEWIGRRLQIGDAVLAIEMTCPRCVMTTHACAELPKDSGVMRKLVAAAGGNLGVYASVEVPGRVRVGDSASLLES